MVKVIAEIGVNHNGDLGLAKELVLLCGQAGADIVKFQTFQADDLALRHAPLAEYQYSNLGSGVTQYKMLKNLELAHDVHEDLLQACSDARVEFLSTGFDLKSLDFLHSLGLKRFKVPSGEIDNTPYLRKIGSFGLPIILSTGMSNLAEIENALITLENCGVQRASITVLHCNTEYPTPMSDVNLKAMNNIGSAFGVSVGYSDHTLGIEVPIAAVALGACIIEKHVTLDRSLEGPDHRASLEPDEFKSMVQGIRNIEIAMGDGVKRPTDSEIANKSIARKSIVASTKIEKGTVFAETNLTTKRPASGLSPSSWDNVIGTIAKKDYEKDDLIEF